MGKKLQYISTCNLNHDLVEYPKGAILEFDETAATRIELLDKGLIIPAKPDDLQSAPASKKVEVYKAVSGEKEVRKAGEDKKKEAAALDKNPNLNDGPLQNPGDQEEEKDPPKRGYCKKCKKEVDVLDAKFITAVNKRKFIKGKCAECNSKIHAVCKKIIEA